MVIPKTKETQICRIHCVSLSLWFCSESGPVGFIKLLVLFRIRPGGLYKASGSVQNQASGSVGPINDTNKTSYGLIWFDFHYSTLQHLASNKYCQRLLSTLDIKKILLFTKVQ
jgi:hypothetical protein